MFNSKLLNYQRLRPRKLLSHLENVGFNQRRGKFHELHGEKTSTRRGEHPAVSCQRFDNWITGWWLFALPI